MTTISNLPLLSFQDFLSGSEVAKRAVAQKLYNAFHTYGWVYLKDFGISKEEIAEMFEMVGSFSLNTPLLSSDARNLRIQGRLNVSHSLNYTLRDP
jgi:hypothetical protein